MSLKLKQLLKELPKNEYNVKKAALKVGYSEGYAKTGIYKQVRTNKIFKEYFNEKTVKKELRLALKKCKSKADYTNVLRSIELMSKILGMQIDKAEVTNVDKPDNQFSLDRLSRIRVNTEPVENKENKLAPEN